VSKLIRRILTGTIVLVGIGAISLKPAQAAIISGQVSGVWALDDDGPDGYQTGDSFTAFYTYNDADLITEITNTNNVTSNSVISPSGITNSISSYSQKDINTSTALLSLVLNSGSVQQVFRFISGVPSPTISWLERQVEDKKDDVVTVSGTGKSTRIFASDCCAKNVLAQYFDAYASFAQVNGVFYNYSSAIAKAEDYANLNGIGLPSTILYASTDQPVTFSSTEVPTPALLPSLIGLGVGALRKRKHQAIA
jgi:hypothetical protein